MSNKSMSVIGRVVKAYRNLYNLPISQFCEKYDLSLSTISKLENGRINISVLGLYRKIAEIMDIPFSDFMAMHEFFETIDDSIIDLMIYNKLSEYYLKKMSKN